MSQNTSENLRRRLTAVITREFGELPPEAVHAVLVELEREWRPATHPPPIPPQALSATGKRTTLQQASEPNPLRRSRAGLGESSSRPVPEISIVVQDEEETGEMLRQIVDIGAILMPRRDPVRVNDLIWLTITFKPAHLVIPVSGRVVNVSDQGMAVELFNMDREDRAAVDQLYQEYATRILQPALPELQLEEISAPKPQQEVHDPRRESSMGRKAKPEADDARLASLAPQAPALPEREESGRTAFSSRPSTSPNATPFPPLRSAAPTTKTRRHIDLTDPDRDVLRSTQANRSITREAILGAGAEEREQYGPLVGWVTPQGDPERVDALATERLLDIFLQLSESGFTGVLAIEDTAERAERQLFFDGGLLVEVLRTPRKPSEELGPMLKLARRLDDTQLAMGAAHAEEHKIPLERALLELELMTPNTLRQAIAGRLTFLLREVSQLSRGTFRVYGASALPSGFLPAPPLRVHVATERIIYQLLYEQLRQLATGQRNELASPELDAYPELVVSERDRADRALVDDDQRRLLERVITGQRRLREVFTESALSHADTFAVVFALHRMGLLRFDRSMHHTVVRERFRENVTVKYLSVHKASYFEVLNVHWSSYDEPIRRAYEELLEQFDLSALPGELDEEVTQRVREIRERVESAYQVLARREHRHAYRMRIMPEYKLAHAIPLFFKQSELAEKRGRLEDAQDTLLRILEIDPQDDEARARLKRVQQRMALTTAASTF